MSAATEPLLEAKKVAAASKDIASDDAFEIPLRQPSRRRRFLLVNIVFWVLFGGYLLTVYRRACPRSASLGSASTAPELRKGSNENGWDEPVFEVVEAGCSPGKSIAKMSRVCQATFLENEKKTRHRYRIAPLEENFSAAEANETDPAPMVVFEVYPPVRVGREYLPGWENSGYEMDVESECTVTLMEHVFGWSYGMPFVGEYNPPPCSWTHVLFNLTVTSAGRQFDRLAMMYLGDVEVWRTSTAEPTWYGIEFGYVKDMTAYASLLKQPQKIIFELGNLVDDKYTGLFTTTLTATFYTPRLSTNPQDPVIPVPNPASQILAISSQQSASNQPSAFHIPKDRALCNLSLPPNTQRAIVSISASGNADEEFWYTNVPSSYTETFPNSSLPGFSSFREVQLWIDGELVGFAWPFATIFTGGINPALWRPVVGIDAYDLVRYEIDITPFLPKILSSDSAASTFEIKVVSYDDITNTISSALGSDWIVSGRVFIWVDPDATWKTTGEVISKVLPEPVFSLNTVLSPGNESLEISLKASRSTSVVSVLCTSTGNKTVAWHQGLSWTHYDHIWDSGNAQYILQVTTGTDAAIGRAAKYYSYPLSINTSFVQDSDHFSISAAVDRGLEINGIAAGWVDFYTFSSPSEVESGEALTGSLRTRQNATGLYDSRGFVEGRTEQSLVYQGVPRSGEGIGEYRRDVLAEAGAVVEDVEVVNGKVVEK
ncbi:hypothetical protein RUND412_002894 [Rhizina undulata]